MARLVWTPFARAALVEIESPAVRRQIREKARLVRDFPGLHPPTCTRSWGWAKHFLMPPYAVVYRHTDDGRECQVLDIFHEDRFAWRELHQP